MKLVTVRNFGTMVGMKFDAGGGYAQIRMSPNEIGEVIEQLTQWERSQSKPSQSSLDALEKLHSRFSSKGPELLLEVPIAVHEVRFEPVSP